MNLKTTVVCLAIATSTPLITTHAADATGKPAASAVGQGLHESRTVEKRATITSIDAAKRLVTLKTADGSQFEVEASADVANFNKLEVGDTVVATYVASIGVHIEPAGKASPGVKETATATPSPGQAKVGREVTATLKVESVDAKNNVVVLSDGAGHSAPVDVVHPTARERLKTLKPGEMVVVTYTEALALRLEKVAAK